MLSTVKLRLTHHQIDLHLSILSSNCFHFMREISIPHFVCLQVKSPTSAGRSPPLGVVYPRLPIPQALIHPPYCLPSSNAFNFKLGDLHISMLSTLKLRLPLHQVDLNFSLLSTLKQRFRLRQVEHPRCCLSSSNVFHFHASTALCDQYTV